MCSPSGWSRAVPGITEAQGSGGRLHGEGPPGGTQLQPGLQAEGAGPAANHSQWDTPWEKGRMIHNVLVPVRLSKEATPTHVSPTGPLWGPLVLGGHHYLQPLPSPCFPFPFPQTTWEPRQTPRTGPASSRSPRKLDTQAHPRTPTPTHPRRALQESGPTRQMQCVSLN